ncbi:MAG TPA: PEP-CTERM sorting domain-containing protein [Methyloversatilis sp.]
MIRKKNLPAIAVALSLAFAPAIGSAEVIGFLGNFDVINDTGSMAHGFEIELEGLHISDITDTFGGPGRGFPTGRGFDPATSVQRYGAPTITEYVNGAVFGTRVTYMGMFSNGSWDYGTPSGGFVTPGDNCWSGGGVGYGASTPCDHFGVGTTKNASRTIYSWLLETQPNSDVLTKNGVALPAPVWVVEPAAVPAPVGQPALPPQRVVAVIEAPDPVPDAAGAEDGAKFGDAIWIKIFKTELQAGVGLEELIGGNEKVDGAELEIEWLLLQKEIGNPLSGRFESVNVGIGENSEAILYRYEFYKFAGEYKNDHEVNFAKGFGDGHPGPGDVGIYLGAQNAAVNFDVAAAVAVPEPSTWLSMLGGLGVLGLMVRRRVG